MYVPFYLPSPPTLVPTPTLCPNLLLPVLVSSLSKPVHPGTVYVPPPALEDLSQTRGLGQVQGLVQGQGQGQGQGLEQGLGLWVRPAPLGAPGLQPVARYRRKGSRVQTSS